MAHPGAFRHRFRHVRHPLTEERRRVQDIPIQRVRILDDPFRAIGIPAFYRRGNRLAFRYQRQPFARFRFCRRVFLRVCRRPSTESRIPVPFGVRVRLRSGFRHEGPRFRCRAFRARDRVSRSGRRVRRPYENPAIARIPLRWGVRVSGAFVFRGTRYFRLRLSPLNGRIRPCARFLDFGVPVLPPCEIRELPVARKRPFALGFLVLQGVLSESVRRVLSVFRLRFRISRRDRGFRQMENVPPFRPAFPVLIRNPARLFLLRGVFFPVFIVFDPRNIAFVARFLHSPFRELPRSSEIIPRIRLARVPFLRI